jgi:hypothetical protein
METVQIHNSNDMIGVTDFEGRHYKANEHGEVTIPSDTARALREETIVRTPRRVFGGFSLPQRPGE